MDSLLQWVTSGARQATCPFLFGDDGRLRLELALSITVQISDMNGLSDQHGLHAGFHLLLKDAKLGHFPRTITARKGLNNSSTLVRAENTLSLLYCY